MFKDASDFRITTDGAEMWDDAAGYPPRKVFGYYSKDSLQYLVKFQRKSLKSPGPQERIVRSSKQQVPVRRVLRSLLPNC